jgi:L-ascorbate metabolism protein UlaG (beta-lactamase superfamily)
MRGGQFLDYPPRKVADIKALLERTLREQSHMLNFAEAIKRLDDLLKTDAKGFSLEPLYALVPDPLKGYVELVYDLNNNPSIRLMEGLLYQSPYYDPGLQSACLSFIKSDARPFMFSTPRLSDENQIHLKRPFAHDGLDALFEMRSSPQTFEYIKDRLGFDDDDDERFRSFLTEKPPYADSSANEAWPRVRYFGHACVLVETGSVNILTDPAISYRYDTELGRYTYADLPAVIDYVLITHTHSDHTVLETLLQLRHKIRNIIVPKNGGGALEDPSLKLILKAVGFKNVYEIEEMESVKVEGGEIVSLPFLGEHCDLRVRSKCAYWVRTGDKTMLFAADSSNLEYQLYEHIHKITGDVDVLFIGMECDGAPLTWIYGALLTRPLDRKMDQSRRLSGSDYAATNGIVKLLNCKKVYVYAMGQEPWLSHIMALQYTEQSKPIIESNQLIADCRDRGIPAERLYVARDYLV